MSVNNRFSRFVVVLVCLGLGWSVIHGQTELGKQVASPVGNLSDAEISRELTAFLDRLLLQMSFPVWCW